jgi:hypothetical protein
VGTVGAGGAAGASPAAAAGGAVRSDPPGTLEVQVSHSSGTTHCSGLQGVMVDGVMSFGTVTFS